MTGRRGRRFLIKGLSSCKDVYQNVEITIKLTDIVGNLIGTNSEYGRLFQVLGGLYLFFNEPYGINAGQQYIAATGVYNPYTSVRPSLVQITLDYKCKAVYPVWPCADYRHILYRSSSGTGWFQRSLPRIRALWGSSRVPAPLKANSKVSTVNKGGTNAFFQAAVVVDFFSCSYNSYNSWEAGYYQQSRKKKTLASSSWT